MPPKSPIFPWIGPFGLHSTPLAAVASPFLSVGPTDLHSPLLASVSLYWPPFPSITPVFPWISPIGLHLPLLDSIPLCGPPFLSTALIFPCIGLSDLHSPVLASVPLYCPNRGCYSFSPGLAPLASIPLCWLPFPYVAPVFPGIGPTGFHSPPPAFTPLKEQLSPARHHFLILPTGLGLCHAHSCRRQQSCRPHPHPCAATMGIVPEAAGRTQPCA